MDWCSNMGPENRQTQSIQMALISIWQSKQIDRILSRYAAVSRQSVLDYFQLSGCTGCQITRVAYQYSRVGWISHSFSKD